MEKQTEENGIRKRGKVEGVRRLKKEARGGGGSPGVTYRSLEVEHGR